MSINQYGKVNLSLDVAYRGSLRRWGRFLFHAAQVNSRGSDNIERRGRRRPVRGTRWYAHNVFPGTCDGGGRLLSLRLLLKEIYKWCISRVVSTALQKESSARKRAQRFLGLLKFFGRRIFLVSRLLGSRNSADVSPLFAVVNERQAPFLRALPFRRWWHGDLLQLFLLLLLLLLLVPARQRSRTRRFGSAVWRWYALLNLIIIIIWSTALVSVLPHHAVLKLKLQARKTVCI